MGSPVVPVLANIYMVELETSLIPNFDINWWFLYADDTICLIKEESIQNFLNILNNFDEKIQLTYEIERNNMLAFMDILLVNNDDFFNTALFRKPTNTDVYINWNAFAPISWKRGTLRSLVRHAYLLRSTDYFLDMELKHLSYAVIK